MARPVVLGNGSLTVGLNEQGLVHDFYYPYVGMCNLTTSRSIHHKIGVWIDGQFSWVDDGNWNIEVDFETDALVSNLTMTNNDLSVSLHFNDFVDSKSNVFARQIVVSNLASDSRVIRLFMHQVFQISSGGRADTAVYVPNERYIYDYKGRNALIIYGQTEDGSPFDQFAIGNYGIEGKEGTYKDAEDGMLSGSAVEHGSVDSVLGFTLDIAGQSNTTVDYWIVASDDQVSAERIHLKFKRDTLSARLQSTRGYWHKWLSIGSNTLHRLDPKYLPAIKKSMLMIKSHIDRRGGIIASIDSSIFNYGRDYYSYVWPRDGVYAIWPLIRLGYTEEAKRFFNFCRDIITKDGYLQHKYQVDKVLGSSWHPWLQGINQELPIQEDETASLIYMLGEYLDHTGDIDYIKGLYPDLIQPASNFMINFMDEQTGLPHASYDLWEEKFITSTYTVSVTYQALLVASDIAKTLGYQEDSILWQECANKIASNSQIFYDDERGLYRKGFLLNDDKSLSFDNVLDISSFYGVMMFGLNENIDQLKSTASKIEEILLDQSPSGGTPRYEDDAYFRSDPAYRGNPWIVTTMWMAQYYSRTDRVAVAKHYLDWALSKATITGTLPEQINPENSDSVSVSPLTWSHAEIVNTILDVTKLG